MVDNLQVGTGFRGVNMVKRTDGFVMNGERYYWDFGEGFSDPGWQQYDTDQDAWYFGAWVNPTLLKTFTYCEGDTTLIECESQEEYDQEIRKMNAFYNPAPIFKVFDLDGTVTHVYDENALHGRTIPELEES